MQIYIVTVQADDYYTWLFVVVNDLGFQTTSCLGYATPYIFLPSETVKLPKFFCCFLAGSTENSPSNQRQNSHCFAETALRAGWFLMRSSEIPWYPLFRRDWSYGVISKVTKQNLNIRIYRHIYICGIQVNTMDLTHRYEVGIGSTVKLLNIPGRT